MPTTAELRRALSALLTDLGCVIGFAALGRRNHDEALTVGGVFETAWPFLLGAVVGWLLCRGWRRPDAVVPTGLTVWAATVIVGMLLRQATSQGTAASFVVVAALVTGVLLIGWRLALAASRRKARPVG